MPDDIAQFFNASDGFTKTGEIAALGLDLVGYFDADAIEYNLDDTGPAAERYTFVCEVFSEWRAAVGQTLTIDQDNYRITNSVADGTGILTLSLFSED